MIARYSMLVVFLLAVVMTAAIGGSFPVGQWYFDLIKPGWNPPPWVFGPVWSVLYVLMGLAMWKVWTSGHHNRTGALLWWLMQLVLNAGWSWLFFGLHRTGWALLELTVLLAVVILCTRAFATVSRPAALWMVPYILWLMFAWVLNITLWSLNGGGLASIMG